MPTPKRKYEEVGKEVDGISDNDVDA